MNHSSRKLSFVKGLLFGSAIAALSTGALLSPSFSHRVNAELEDNPKALVDEVWQLVNEEFVDRNFNQVEWVKIMVLMMKPIEKFVNLYAY
jgi:carboxyl-terminal processing protease